MFRFFRLRRQLFFLSLCGAIFLSGCQGGSGKKDEPPSYDPPRVLEPEAPGKTTLGGETLLLDTSRTDHGYMTAKAAGDGAMKTVQVLSAQTGVNYTYFLNSGETAVIPFTDGEGSYLVTGYQQLEGSQYAALFSEQLEITLENVFYPFLYPNQYVHFSADSDASRLALSLLPADASDLDGLAAIYDYVINNVVYDEEKAATVEAGYLPVVDDTLHTGTGICFDYAALMTAMLRARDIPCRLVTGYAGTVKHAWIDVYIRNKGWVEQAIAFDGETWTRMDPTFYASSTDTEFILDYIGDGSNYSEQYAH